VKDVKEGNEVKDLEDWSTGAGCKCIAPFFLGRLLQGMTRRQKEIVQLLAEGRPDKEIADILALSQKTVEFHKHHIRESFNLHSNADIVLLAVKQGLISVEI